MPERDLRILEIDRFEFQRTCAGQTIPALQNKQIHILVVYGFLRAIVNAAHTPNASVVEYDP